MTTGLVIDGVVVRYGALTAVGGVSLRVPHGSIVALLGPSGSGKSTLLRAIAGLEPLAAGRIAWDGEDLAAVPVHKRGFGLVFQDGQLFATMNTERNIAYGLGRMAKAARRRRVADMLDLVGLPGYEARKTTELSGGQAQRVALARSLAPAPRALLLDEPLAALDAGLRRRLAEDLARILREAGTTAVYVTHDHREAYTVADEIAILDEGSLLQAGAVETLRNAPASREIARFLGAQAFLTEVEAQALGWSGRLGAGQVLAVGPGSLAITDDGVEVEILDQGYTIDGVEVGVRLPGGQRVLVSAPARFDTDRIPVRLVRAAAVPV